MAMPPLSFSELRRAEWIDFSDFAGMLRKHLKNQAVVVACPQT
ncbi:hypothetical protein RE6C_04024 [Rhodopirellula europaea 6C]|uniref:Uncharacterized protein n=1 Tax=Rhodopirellula europaea 6C TaxID=1263867 RepID=M2AR90_9BACT|nr:hypothetical protein RE6C_04024 [Rhodopirellula europaea 6C]